MFDQILTFIAMILSHLKKWLFTATIDSFAILRLASFTKDGYLHQSAISKSISTQPFKSLLLPQFYSVLIKRPSQLLSLTSMSSASNNGHKYVVMFWFEFVNTFKIFLQKFSNQTSIYQRAHVSRSDGMPIFEVGFSCQFRW